MPICSIHECSVVLLGEKTGLLILINPVHRVAALIHNVLMAGMNNM